MKQGYTTLPDMLTPAHLQALDAALGAAPENSRRMLQLGWCRELAEEVRMQLIASGLISADYVAVQCTYFEKSRGHNWLVALHQDLSIPVKMRIEHASLSGWSEKDGALFVHPPVAVLEQLLALRLHIDTCGPEDGALKVIPGSHLNGRLDENDKARAKAGAEAVLCPVAQGAGMAMRPLLLHASSKATGSSRRRVLHFLFGPPALPFGLEWA